MADPTDAPESVRALAEEHTTAAFLALDGGRAHTAHWHNRTTEVLTRYAAHLAAPASEVRVKPLEWRDTSYGDCFADSHVGRYQACAVHGGWLWYLSPNPKGALQSRDEAKAAAQADYEARILSCLEPTS